MSNKNNYKDRVKVGDYKVDCQMCGQTCWASKSRVLSKDTGRGGLRVCPNCVDSIDYSLIPYTIRPEPSVPFSNNAQQSTTTGRQPVDYSSFDPLSGDLS